MRDTAHAGKILVSKASGHGPAPKVPTRIGDESVL
jgi:hypothetical protein